MRVLNKMSMMTTLSLCVSSEFTRAVFVYYGGAPHFFLNRALLYRLYPAMFHHIGDPTSISSQLRHVSTIGKKNLLSSDTSSACPDNMVNFGPLTAEIGSGVWGTPTNFNGFCVLAALLHGI